MEEQALILRELLRTVHLLQQQVDALSGESFIVELTPSQPSAIIAFTHCHPNSRYFVHTCVLEEDDGSVEEIAVTHRQRNGFQLSYHGSARRAVIDIWVQDRPTL